MRTFHLSLDVPDLGAAVAFYRELFALEPAKERPGYAKFELADPPLVLTLQQAPSPGLSHLGLRVGSSADVDETAGRLRDGGLATLEERETACCYALQDKVWVADPAGHRWEVYTVLADVETEQAEACCAGSG